MKLAVFCGSSSGHLAVYTEAATALGILFANQGIELIYGGGHVGLMGAIADATLGAGGRVTGVMPTQLVEREIAHEGLTQLIVVKDMHERKATIAELADGFIAMPGGAGTLEEITEQWTWAQLGIHQKPCAFLNVNDYYEPLKLLTTTMVQNGFMKAEYADMLIYEKQVDKILTAMKQYIAPTPKWQN
ncbi:MAG: TIGR00730 family Rossman fold protein [Rhizobiales bacterium]|nr:TIGR00730 family Rossman fold protein [Hyphomicrobiales bacterium]NRB14734.1 TIGR00730 family Rossman fold protein [Hyphomicrobiales bacterium]